MQTEITIRRTDNTKTKIIMWGDAMDIVAETKALGEVDEKIWSVEVGTAYRHEWPNRK